MQSSCHLIKFLIIFAILSCPFCQFIVWDDYIDLCGKMPSSSTPQRPALRCEKANIVMVEKQLYRDEEPYWCIKINNTQGHTHTALQIQLNGDEIYRAIETTRNVKRHSTLNNYREESFELVENKINTIVISPTRPLHELQRIISMKLDNEELCSAYKADEVDNIFPSPQNSLLLRHLKKCYVINSRIHRPRNRCELNDKVIYEELSFRGEEYFMCVIIDSGNDTSITESNDQILEIRLSNSNYYHQSSHVKRLHDIQERNNLKFQLKSGRHSSAFVAHKNKIPPVIQSIKINGIESCRTRINPNDNNIPCGQQKIKHKPLITFGEPTYYGQYPWHVALYELSSERQPVYICGGTIVSQNAVVTAAHCIHNNVGIKSQKTLRVQLGKHDLTSFYPNTREFRVFEIIPHPDFDSVYLENDIAILKLQTIVEYSEYIQPICITERDDTFSERVGVVPGWGKNELNEEGRILYDASMPLVDAQECRRSNRQFFGNFLNEYKFCAGYRNGTSVCAGDSGGGLVIEQSAGWYLKGVVSLGVGSQEAENMCDISQFVLFTDVVKYVNWIIEYVRD